MISCLFISFSIIVCAWWLSDLVVPIAVDKATSFCKRHNLYEENYE